MTRRSTVARVAVAATLAFAPGCGGATGTDANGTFPDLGGLRTDWGCGYGFARSDAEQSVAVVIQRPDAGPELLGTDVATVSLPDPAWRAEIRVGTDLFANWCDDVIDPAEPTPVVAHRWPIEDGTLEISLPTLEQSAHAEGVLHGAVVVVDGARRELPEVRFTNTTWGAFAG